MKECFKTLKRFGNLLGHASCSYRRGGKVKKSVNGAHIGIANDIQINFNGINHPYINLKIKNSILQHLIL